MISTSGRWASQARNVSASWFGRRSRTAWRSRSTRMVPQAQPRRLAQASTPSTGTAGVGGRAKPRMSPSSVSRLIISASSATSYAPGAPPSARPIAPDPAVSRAVCRLRAGPRNGSTKMRRRQLGASQKKRRVCSVSGTVSPCHGRSDSVRA
jgi:hypothetical protein